MLPPAPEKQGIPCAADKRLPIACNNLCGKIAKSRRAALISAHLGFFKPLSQPQPFQADTLNAFLNSGRCGENQG